MPVMASTASVFGTAERCGENLAEVAVPVAQALLVRVGSPRSWRWPG